MLAPDDRSVLLDLLRPPADYALDAAVATTFTLDLDAALVAPLAFTSFDSAGLGDPIAALESIRSVANRLTVFCQAGAMAVPQRASDLFTFLESVVHEVRQPPGHLFHPKLWFLRFVSDDGLDRLRLLVPTRNLTNDVSWDAVLALDAEVKGGPSAANAPLTAILRWCLANTIQAMPAARVAQVESVIESFRRAEWELPSGFRDVAFYGLGVGRNERPDFSGDRQMVISPFVNDDGLALVAPTKGALVVSRTEQLECLAASSLEGVETFAMSNMGTAERAEDEKEPPPSLGDLHAKVFVVDRGRWTHLFMGSANATSAAFGGNVEVLVELQGPVKDFGVEATRVALGDVLEPCNVTGGSEPTSADLLQKEMQRLLRSVAERRLTLVVTEEEGNGHRLALTSDAPLVAAGTDATISLELLTQPGKGLAVVPGERASGEYRGVALADITPFVVVRLELRDGTQRAEGSTVVRARLQNDPAGRADAVIARQVDTPEKFLKFLFLLLGLAGGAMPWLPPSVDGDGAFTDGAGRLLDMGVFETLMRALATNPSALDELGRLVERLQQTEHGQRSLPPGFNEVWNTVIAARALVGGAR